MGINEIIEKVNDGGLECTDLIERHDYNGYSVYEPYFGFDGACVGTPIFILVKDEDVKIADGDEGFEVLDYLIKVENIKDDEEE